MKNLTFALLTGIVVCLSCGKKGVEPEQKIFENIESCCKKDEICITPVVLNNLIGTLVSHTTDNTGKSTYYNIALDKRPIVADSILPLFKWFGAVLDVCNLPEKLINSDKQRRVRFDCKLFFVPAPTDPNERIPHIGSYPAIVTQIELLD